MLARSILRRRPRGLRALSSAPLLPRWGSFGKDASQIDGFIETVREEGAQHVKLTRELAERGLRLYMMLTRPHLWFSDAEWRKGWLEQASEPMDRDARINYELMEGCEFAYRALAEEFCRAEPDFEAFVESGYDNVARLCELINNVRTPDDPRFTTFLTAVGMTKPGHIHRFVSYMERRANRPWLG